MVVVLIGWSPDKAADQNPKHTLWRSEHSHLLLRISLLSLGTVFLGQRAVTLLCFKKISFDVVKNIPGMNKSFDLVKITTLLLFSGPLCVVLGRGIDTLLSMSGLVIHDQ